MNHFTWGELELMPAWEGFQPAHVPAANVEEIEVLPAPGDVGPDTVLQAGPRHRERIMVEVIATSMALYRDLQAAWRANEVRDLTTFDEVRPAMIFELGPPRWVYNNLVKFDVTFIEAASDEGGE